MFPVIVAFNPSSGKLVNSPEKIEIEFQSLTGFSINNFFVSSLPEAQFELEKRENKLVIKLTDDLLSGEKYLLELRYSNQPLYNWSYYLVPPLPTPTLVSERGEPGIKEKIIKQTAEDYPLILEIPYETDNFSLGYVSPLTLGIQVKKGSKEEAAKEIYKWIESKGLTPSSHEFIWLE